MTPTLRWHSRPRTVPALEVSFIILVVVWLVFLLQSLGLWRLLFAPWLGEGMVPRDFDYLLSGPITMPLLHGGLEHLTGNSVALAVLLPLFFLSHSQWKTAWGRLALLWIVAGLLLWIIGPGASRHIGASGLVYALTGYLVVYGLRGGHWVALASGVLVLFFQAASIWSGLIPVDPGISYAGHWSGLLVGASVGWFAVKQR